MVEKRKVGQRGYPLLDSIDYKILRLLEGLDLASESNVLSLVKNLNISHTNLKSHLHKLMDAKLIVAFKDEQNPNKVNFVTINKLENQPGLKNDFESTMRVLGRLISKIENKAIVNKLITYADKPPKKK